MSTGASNYTHELDEAGDVIYCSEAEQWTDSYTGEPLPWGWCPHITDDDGLPLAVAVEPPAREEAPQ